MLPTHCRRCGQQFRPSIRRASLSEFGGARDLCDWCDLQENRAGELFDELIASEADVRAKITAEHDAIRAGWRFWCERATPRRQKYLIRIAHPSGAILETIGEPNGLNAYEAECTGRDRIVRLARVALTVVPS
jgi:hypothetical protein